MERFEGNGSLAAILGLTGLFMLCFVAYFVNQIVLEAGTVTLAMAAVVAYGMGGLSAAGFFLLWSAREIGASFVLDDQGITRRAWGRTTVLHWRDLARFDELSGVGFKGQSNMFGRLFLHGSDGTRMTIRFHLLPDGSHLRARLEPHLAPLREADVCDLAKHGRSLRPFRMVGILVLTCVLPIFLFGGLSGLNVFQTDRQTNDRGSWYIGVLGIGASPILAILGLELISRKLTIGPNALKLRSLFLARSILFSRVASIDVKTSQSNDGFGFERAKIRAENGQSITLESTMPGYRPALELLRKHVDAKAHLDRLADPDFA